MLEGQKHLLEKKKKKDCNVFRNIYKTSNTPEGSAFLGTHYRTYQKGSFLAKCDIFANESPKNEKERFINAHVFHSPRLLCRFRVV